MNTVSHDSNGREQRGISLSLRNISRQMPLPDSGGPDDSGPEDSRPENTGSGSNAPHSKGLEIVTDVNLEVQRGETCAVVGASGSGKTTLLGIMAGMDAPDSGDVILGGRGSGDSRGASSDGGSGSSGSGEQSLYALNEEQRAQIRARDMGFVFQNFQLVADMHALDNILLSLELSYHARGKQSRANIRALASEWLAKVGLGDRQFHFPRQLSGGEQQRVALARAFACQPGILFADEPTGSLDEDTAEDMIALLFSLSRDTGSTMVLVTHDQALASRCDSIYRLEKHRLRPVSSHAPASQAQ